MSHASDYQFSFLYPCKCKADEGELATKIYNKDNRYNLIRQIEHKYYCNFDGECPRTYIKVVHWCDVCKEKNDALRAEVHRMPWLE